MSHPFEQLGPRGKFPKKKRDLDAWIQQAEDKVGVGIARLGWMVASGIVIAALQRVAYEDSQPRFLLKGGTYLELLLGLQARTTNDVDALFRGNFDDLLEALDKALAEPFYEFTFERIEPEIIEVPGRVNKPRRIEIKIKLQGKTWRRLPIEVSADEGRAGAGVHLFPTPPLDHFGLEAPPKTAGLTIDYQVAQKLHACTQPSIAEYVNDRVRDVADLLLLKSAFYEETDLTMLSRACRDLFLARAAEATETGEVEPREWPPLIISQPNWPRDYPGYADEVGIELDLDGALEELNQWIREIDGH